MKVLFVCVENSCRSQMAEGFARAAGATAYSAGSKPSGKVNETAIAVMKERGIDLSSHASKGIEALPETGWDFVVSMGCGDACPCVPAKTRLDWAIPDPKGKPIEEFRVIRDLIEAEVRALLFAKT